MRIVIGGRHMLPDSLIVPLVCDRGHSACCRVAMSTTTGWEVSVEIDGRVVSVSHCGDWHRVERLCEVLRRLWLNSYAPASARR